MRIIITVDVPDGGLLPGLLILRAHLHAVRMENATCFLVDLMRVNSVGGDTESVRCAACLSAPPQAQTGLWGQGE